MTILAHTLDLRYHFRVLCELYRKWVIISYRWKLIVFSSVKFYLMNVSFHCRLWMKFARVRDGMWKWQEVVLDLWLSMCHGRLQWRRTVTSKSEICLYRCDRWLDKNMVSFWNSQVVYVCVLMNNFWSIDDTGMLESMWSSMSSSMQLAQECLEREGDVPLVPSNTIDGLERFAQLIDNGKSTCP